jgi:hypothetical protein
MRAALSTIRRWTVVIDALIVSLLMMLLRRCSSRGGASGRSSRRSSVALVTDAAWRRGSALSDAE